MTSPLRDDELETEGAAPSRAPESAVRRKLRTLRNEFDRWSSKCYRIKNKFEIIVPLVLNAAQIKVERLEAEELRKHGRARIYVLKGRQGGITTHQQAKSLHTIWSRRGAVCLTLAHERTTTDRIFEITRRAIENFPEDLLPELGAAQKREISFPQRDSSFYTGTAAASRAGHGLTLLRFHGSEFALWDDPVETLKGVIPSLERPGTTGILETTASMYESDAHLYWRGAMTGENNFRPLFLPWWECDPTLYRMELEEPDELGKLSDEEQTLVDVNGLHLEEIKWRRHQIRDLGKTGFLQQYPEDDETCWLAAGGLFYDAELLKELKQRAAKPARIAASDLEVTDATLTSAKIKEMRALLRERLEVYSKLEPMGDGDRCIIGADTAEGGGDRNALVARWLTNWRLGAIFATKEIEPREFAGVLNALGRRMVDAKGRPALLVIERNLHGITVLRHLRDDHSYPVEYIYHRQKLDSSETDPREQHASDRMGWHTNAESKPLLLDGGRDLLNAARDKLASPPSDAAITDAFGIRRDKTGRVNTNGRDVFVSELLAWVGRSYPIRPNRPSGIRLID
jgi:hypothetical protein